MTAEQIIGLIGQPESENLEYKAVLPPSRALGQIICAFGNKSGGVIILGIAEVNQKFIINGLSEDFHSGSVIYKAVDLITPRPVIRSERIIYMDKSLLAVVVEPSAELLAIEGKRYLREGVRNVLQNPPAQNLRSNGDPEIKKLAQNLNSYRLSATSSKAKLLDHYQSVLNILDDLGNLLYPSSPNLPTDQPEGKILMRILIASCADNFETYLTDLLYEIFLANPATLKSPQTVTIKEVLDCADMEEFVNFWAKKKLSKLQRGNVNGFLSENEQLDSLKAINQVQQEKIEKILQIRHLYTHRNGIVDDKFLKSFAGQYALNDEHRLSLHEAVEILGFLAEIADQIDTKAAGKYRLAKFD